MEIFVKNNQFFNPCKPIEIVQTVSGVNGIYPDKYTKCSLADRMTAMKINGAALFIELHYLGRFPFEDQVYDLMKFVYPDTSEIFYFGYFNDGVLGTDDFSIKIYKNGKEWNPPELKPIKFEYILSGDGADSGRFIKMFHNVINVINVNITKLYFLGPYKYKNKNFDLMKIVYKNGTEDLVLGHFNDGVIQ
jgi:hypothetical protein